MKITKINNEDRVEKVMKEIEKKDRKGIAGYMDDVLLNILELFVRVQRIEERLEKLENKKEEKVDRNDEDYKLAVKFLVRSWDSPAEQTIGLAEIFKGIREEGRKEEYDKLVSYLAK